MPKGFDPMRFQKWSSKIRVRLHFVVDAWNGRSSRQKMALIVAALAAVLALDVFVLIRPVAASFIRTLPEFMELQKTRDTLRSDIVRKEEIRQTWESKHAELEEREKSLIGQDEVPMVLETLSKWASESGVKITTLQPREPSATEKRIGGFYPIFVEMNGFAGAHPLGQFLEKVELSQMHLAVVDVRVMNNPTDDRKHLFVLVLQALRADK